MSSKFKHPRPEKPQPDQAALDAFAKGAETRSTDISIPTVTEQRNDGVPQRPEKEPEIVVEEGSKKLTVKLDRARWLYLKALCAQTDTSAQKIFIQALDEHFSRASPEFDATIFR